MRLRSDFRRRLEEVLACPTAPFHEGRVHGVIRAAVAESTRLRDRVDDVGNLEVVYGAGRPRLLFACHTDHPALEARGDGTAIVRGGIRPAHLEGVPLRLFARPGPVATVTTVASRDWPAVVRLRGGRNLKRGTPLLLDVADFRITDRHIRARAIDDLCAVAACLTVFDRLEKVGFDGTVGALFTRAEEVGMVGAIAWTRTTRYPKATTIVNLEMSPALKHTRQGDGPILRIGDRLSTFSQGPAIDLESVASRLKKKSRGFLYQRALMDGGACEATAYSHAGFRTSALCLPLKNYHNHTARGGMGLEQVSAPDAENLVRWMVAYAGSFDTVDASRAVGARLDRLLRTNRRSLERSAGEGKGR